MSGTCFFYKKRWKKTTFIRPIWGRLRGNGILSVAFLPAFRWGTLLGCMFLSLGIPGRGYCAPPAIERGRFHRPTRRGQLQRPATKVCSINACIPPSMNGSELSRYSKLVYIIIRKCVSRLLASLWRIFSSSSQLQSPLCALNTFGCTSAISSKLDGARLAQSFDEKKNLHPNRR